MNCRWVVCWVQLAVQWVLEWLELVEPQVGPREVLDL
jgi:hypothetical protein